jgi:hypothetical protein
MPIQPPDSRFIGYFNKNPYPVVFPLSRGRSAPIHLEPGEPIVDAQQGRLIPPGQPELDEEVRLGTIAYISAKDPNFQDWDRRAAQRNSIQFGASKVEANFDPTSIPIPHAPAEVEQERVAHVSAAAPTHETDETPQPYSPIGDGTVPHNAIDLAHLTGSTAAGDFEGWFDSAKASGELTQKKNGRIEYLGEEFLGKGALRKYLEAKRQQQAVDA